MGETVVYVPITCASGPVGVVEIHGLYSAGITNTSSFERPPAILIAFAATMAFGSIRPYWPGFFAHVAWAMRSSFLYQTMRRSFMRSNSSAVSSRLPSWSGSNVQHPVGPLGAPGQRGLALPGGPVPGLPRAPAAALGLPPAPVLL